MMTPNKNRSSESPPRFSPPRRAAIPEGVVRSTVPLGGVRSPLALGVTPLASLGP